MKVRSSFVTNSSTSNFVICNLSKEERSVKSFLLENVGLLDKFNTYLKSNSSEFNEMKEYLDGFDGHFVENTDYVSFDVHKRTENDVTTQEITFQVATGIPYATSIKQVAEDMKKTIEELGYSVKGNVQSEVEERWE